MTRTDDLTVEEALARVLAGVPVLEAERLPLSEALGRVLAEPVAARESLPPFANSAMDGYALRAADVSGASRESPAVLEVVGDIAGRCPETVVGPGQAVRHDWAPLPGCRCGRSGGDDRQPWRDGDRPRLTDRSLAPFRRTTMYVSPAKILRPDRRSSRPGASCARRKSACWPL